MISTLHGKITEYGEQHVVIDCGGIGYFVHVPKSVINGLLHSGEECRLFTILNISKTDVSLVGFLTENQRSCFQMLTSVSGAGTRAGLKILGELDVPLVYQAIVSEDAEAFTQVKGIGRKLAQSIILECKDKVWAGYTDRVLFPFREGINTSILLAVEALTTLGYKQKEAMTAISGIDNSLEVEEIVSQALKKL